MTKISKQRGGTLLGIIIGLIVGLGIALGVALMITKSSTPFKLPRPDKIDTGSNPVGDPNKPLHGSRAPAQQAAPKQADKPAPAAQPADRNIAAAKPEAQPAAVPAAAATAIEPVKAAPSKQAAKAEEDKWQYFLQAGAFRESKDAEATRARLALIGVDAQVTERQSENGTLYRVRIGPFAQLEAMNRVRGKLSDNGMDAAVVRTSR